MSFAEKFKPGERLQACPFLNRTYQKAEKLAQWLSKHGVSPNFITFCGLGLALLGLNFLATGHFFIALLCLLANRFCDIMDGVLSRLGKITRFGAFFDIFADYTAAALFIWGFILAAPANNAGAGSFLLVSQLISAAALLGFSSVSGRNFYQLNQSGLRICAWGTLQNFDTFSLLLLMCLFPGIFVFWAILAGLIALGKSLLIVSGAYYNLEIAGKRRKI